MTGRVKSITLSDLKKIHREAIAQARRDGAGPIADHYREFAAVVEKRAEEVAR